MANRIDYARGAARKRRDEVADQTRYISPNRIGAFRQLWEAICRHHGTQKAALESLGLSCNFAWRMAKGRLSANQARKILNEYHRIKGEAA